MPIVSEQTVIAPETDDAHLRIQQVADMWHDPEYRITQLAYLQEALEDELDKAKKEVFLNRPIKSFKVNGVLFEVREDIRKAWHYLHNPAYRILKERISSLEKDMRIAYAKANGTPETTARYKANKKYMNVYLLGNAHGEVPREKYIKE